MSYETRFLIALFLTVVIEAIVLVLIMRYFFKIKKISIFQIVFVGILASALTLPYLWFVLPNYLNGYYYILIGELAVAVLEGVIYWRIFNLRFYKALTLSLIANAVSLSLGWIIMPLIG
jgi:hypothetical protein